MEFVLHGTWGEWREVKITCKSEHMTSNHNWILHPRIDGQKKKKMFGFSLGIIVEKNDEDSLLGLVMVS